MTDREQTILKAIAHAGRGGLALISDVVRAVGYPKATTKKTLVELSEKGIVSLHRHDYPSSLAPADRKLMISLKGDYYNAVSVRKKNPRGKHLPGLPAKAQREYEHVLKSERAMGRTVKRAKQIAAGKVRKDYGRNPHGMGDKAWKAQENVYRKSIAAYRSKGWTFQQIKDRFWLRFGVTLDKLTDESATFVPIFGREGGFVLDLVPPLERRRMASKAKKTNPRRKKNTTVIKARKVVIRKVINSGVGRKAKGSRLVARAEALKTTAKGAKPKRRSVIKRKRNLDHKDATHQVQVSKHWRAGGLSQWQRAHKAGQHDLFAHGIKARNPSAKDSTKWEKLWGAYIKALSTLDKPIKGANARAATARLAKAEKAIQKFDPDAYKRLILGRKNPKRNDSRAKHARSSRKARAGASRAGRKAAKSRKRPRKRNATPLTSLVKKAVKAIKKAVKKKRNPSASQIRKNFAGRHDHDDRLIFPNGTPTGLAKLGRLVSISTDAGRVAPVNGTAWLCSDTKGKLHIGTPTKGHVVFGGPATNYGHVREIEYEESKPHLGYAKKTLFFHKLGEETGVKPRLVTDGKGGAKFIGGAYKIKREGIIN